MTPRDPKHPGSAGRGASSKVLRTYDAFISYAHDDHQAGVVSELHRRLERFTKPWWKARDMQVYRDRTAMGAAPDLWDTIVDAMTVSGWMIRHRLSGREQVILGESGNRVVAGAQARSAADSRAGGRQPGLVGPRRRLGTWRRATRCRPP